MASTETAQTNGNGTAQNYHKLDSPGQIQELLGADLNRLSLLYFRAGWAEVCQTADLAVKSLAEKWSEPIFIEIEAESLPDVAESFEVTSVPSFLILRGHRLLSRIVGAKLSELESNLEKFLKAKQDKSSVGQPSGSAETEFKEETEEQVFARCKTLMNQSKVVLFMKGDPKVPRCGFSQTAAKILQDLNIEFTSFDILSDDSIRQGMKKLNSWPTFPQLIIKGELVGGLDILKELIKKDGDEKSELEAMLEDN
ncbi:monothiol glutaredoxin-4 [Phakopsora pachyrhizi]|nr:monothiol glutaredoxin-4 [Phakopsora pachyrhizi]